MLFIALFARSLARSPACLSYPSPTAGSCTFGNDNFVRAQGRFFVQNCQRFFYNGYNAYYIFQDTSHTVQVLQLAQDLGLNVVRVHSFSDGLSGPNYLQPYPGVYNEETFKKMDFMLYQVRGDDRKDGDGDGDDGDDDDDDGNIDTSDPSLDRFSMLVILASATPAGPSPQPACSDASGELLESVWRHGDVCSMVAHCIRARRLLHGRQLQGDVQKPPLRHCEQSEYVHKPEVGGRGKLHGWMDRSMDGWLLT